MTVSERLADHIVGLPFHEIPRPVVERTKDLLAHHLGLMLRARAATSGETAIRVEQAIRLAHDAGVAEHGCGIVGDHRTAALVDAIFANAALLGATPVHDTLPHGSHPGIVTQPVGWTIGAAMHAPGSEVITAVVVGYDVLGKLGKDVSIHSHAVARRMNNIFGPLAAAATAARVLGLSRGATVDALGHAAHMGVGIVEGMEFFWPIDPLLARAGVTAALFARAGIPMARTVVEGDAGLFRTFYGHVPETLPSRLDELGHDFEIATASTKRYEASFLNTVPIELMLSLRRAHGLLPPHVAAIETVLPAERESVETMREGMLERDALRVARTRSLRYQLATIVAHGDLDPGRYEGPIGQDVASLLPRIRLRFEPGHPLAFARVTVATADGRTHTAEGDRFDEPALDRAHWLRTCGSALLPETQLAELAALLDRLDEVEDVTSVMACARPRT